MNKNTPDTIDTAHAMHRLGVRTLCLIGASVIGCLIAYFLALDSVSVTAVARWTAVTLIALAGQLFAAATFFVLLRRAVRGYRSRKLGTEALAVQLAVSLLAFLSVFAVVHSTFPFKDSATGTFHILSIAAILLAVSPSLIIWRACSKLEAMFLTDRKIRAEA